MPGLWWTPHQGRNRSPSPPRFGMGCAPRHRSCTSDAPVRCCLSFSWGGGLGPSVGHVSVDHVGQLIACPGGLPWRIRPRKVPWPRAASQEPPQGRAVAQGSQRGWDQSLTSSQGPVGEDPKPGSLESLCQAELAVKAAASPSLACSPVGQAAPEAGGSVCESAGHCQAWPLREPPPFLMSGWVLALKHWLPNLLALRPTH